MKTYGYTLIEVMFVVAIFTVVSAVMFSMALSFNDSAEMQNIKANSNDAARRAFTTLLPEVRQAARNSMNLGSLPGGTLTYRIPVDTNGNGTAVDQNGKEHHLADERGHAVIVYFYPKDGTPGCTKEACAFRDAWNKFKDANVQVFGVSEDDAKSHEEFSKEQKLPFPILADANGDWLRAFGVPLRLGMAARVSFLIDANGLVKPIAYVVARESRDGLGPELQAFVRERLDAYKHPREVVFVDALPRTHLGKVDRGRLRQPAVPR